VSAVLVDLGATPAEAAHPVALLAQNPEPPPGRGEEFGKASPVGLVVVVLLLLATVVLIRSMTKRIRRLPASFDDDDDGRSERPGAADATDGRGDGSSRTR
jgi:hypothetical protein